MGKIQKTVKQKDVEKLKAREKNRDRMRKKRDELRKNPLEYQEAKKRERERYKRRVEAGKIKKISEVEPRKQRAIRKDWKEKQRKSRLSKKRTQKTEKKLDNDTPPQSPSSEGDHVIYSIQCSHNKETIPQKDSHQKKSGKKKSRKNREELKRLIDKLRNDNKKLKMKCNKYKVRCSRLKKQESQADTPKKTVKKVLAGQNAPKSVQRKLLFSEVFQAQLRQNMKETNSLKERRMLLKYVSGKIIKKYRCQRMLLSLASQKLKTIPNNNLLRNELSKMKILETRRAITAFLELDENSRMAAGKKETITRKNEKKQKRYLNDTLLNMHIKFIKAYPNKKICYSTFCKMRPFWIVAPPQKRQTCLCQQCENIAFVVSKLNQLKIVEENKASEIIRSICCEDQQDMCLMRMCSNCKLKEIKYTLESIDENDSITYEKWITTKVPLVIKGKEKLCQKTKKATLSCSKKDLIVILKCNILKHMTHVLTIKNQHKKITQIKKELSKSEVLIHMDFSENFEMKYNRSIQSAHFGASKEQLSLHTVVVYVRTSDCDDDDSVQPISICTVSSSLRHDPAAICVHLDPVITLIKDKVSDLKTAYFLSDSPTTQYRNKKMFFLMGTYLAKKLNADFLQWHYSESGHGKGAPDGVGGCLKRMADNIVSLSEDITSCGDFIRILKDKCLGIKIMGIDETKINYLDTKIPEHLITLKGTMRVHQITWRKSEKYIVEANSLSCLVCKPSTLCRHFHVGTIDLKATSFNDFDENNVQTRTGSGIQIEENSSCCDIEVPTTSNFNYLLRENTRVRYEDVYSDSEDSSLKVDIEVQDFVLVKLCGKRSVKYYIAQIISKDEDGEFDVKYLRRSSKNCFVFPNVDDVASVDINDVVQVLQKPSLKRGHYYFTEELDHLISLC